MDKNGMLMRIGVGSALVLASLVVWSKFGFLNIFFVFLPSTILSSMIIWLINQYMWRVPYVKKFFGNIPNLNGKWDVKTLKNGDVEPHTIQATVVQTWSSISLQFIGPRVVSNSTIASVYRSGEFFKIEYMWTGNFRPEYSVQGKIEGAGILQIHSNGLLMNGTYWTYADNNSSIGSMEFIRQ